LPSPRLVASAMLLPTLVPLPLRSTYIDAYDAMYVNLAHSIGKQVLHHSGWCQGT
jgi:hypothetical protein